MKYYKLLNQDLTSYNHTEWEIGVPVTVTVEGNKMCSNQVLHCYNHPLLAVILNPIHGNISNPKLFEISVDKIVNNDGLKFASKSQTLLKKISLPFLSTEQKVEFAIKVVKTVYSDEKWNEWADQWLSGSDRSIASARSAVNEAYNIIGYNNDVSKVIRCCGYAASYAYSNASYYVAHYVAPYVANVVYYSKFNNDENEFNQKIIELIERIDKVEEQ